VFFQHRVIRNGQILQHGNKKGSTASISNQLVLYDAVNRNKVSIH
jgi:hypothetical protein